MNYAQQDPLLSTAQRAVLVKQGRCLSRKVPTIEATQIPAGKFGYSVREDCLLKKVP